MCGMIRSLDIIFDNDNDQTGHSAGCQLSLHSYIVCSRHVLLSNWLIFRTPLPAWQAHSQASVLARSQVFVAKIVCIC